MQGFNNVVMTGATQSLATVYANRTVLGNTVCNAVGIQAGGAALGGLVTAGAGVAGGYVVNILGESIFLTKSLSRVGKRRLED